MTSNKKSKQSRKTPKQPAKHGQERFFSFPKRLQDFDKSYRAVVRELSKR